MFRLITFIIVCTHSLMAQAAGISGSVRLDTQKWVTAYKGEVEIDGLSLVVNMDIAHHSLEIPEAMVRLDPGMSTVVPLYSPADRKAYRLNFIVSHNTRIQTSYQVQPRTVSVDGAPRLAYVSELDAKRDFAFLVTAQEDGVMQVVYSRRLTGGNVSNGQILLSPVR